MNLAPITLAIHTLGRDRRQELIDDVRAGLGAARRSLPPRWFYDEPGCELFEAITELPEYYQTRTEMAILELAAGDLVGRVTPDAIVELGAGSCTKSRILIRAAKGAGTLGTFVPFDISETTIRRSASALVDEFTDVAVYCVAGEFDRHLGEIPRFGRQLIVFLGSTIGNFEPDQATRFLTAVRDLMEPGDGFLLGVDLVKPVSELVAAYDDAAGVTARFNLNLLARVNRELGADFDLAAWRHVALWNQEESRIEMHLRSVTDQSVHIPAASLEVRFAEGETLRTEICTKYTPERVEVMLRSSGMTPETWYLDERSRFGVVLARS